MHEDTLSWSHLLRDLRMDASYALRTLARRPVVAIVPVMSSALGIAACTLIVAVANVALFRPLPVADSSRLMSVSASDTKTGEAGGPISYPDYADIAATHSFESIAAYFPMVPAALSIVGGEPHRQWGTIATAKYFDTVRPGFLLGRGFDSARDDTPGAAPVVVLSHRLWASHFGSAPSILGRPILINGRAANVIGVARPGFRGTDVAIVSDFWIPWSMRDLVAPMLPSHKLDMFADRDAKWLFVVGRLTGATSPAQADAELRVAGLQLAKAYPATNKDRGFHVERAGQLIPVARRAMWVLFLLLLIVSGLVLLTACANVANLLLARATARRREMGTRRAVGAGPTRLLRQLLTESVILALVGGLLGFLLAAAGASSFSGLRLPLGIPVDLSIPVDYRVLFFCAALSFVTGIVFGLAPALESLRLDLVDSLKNTADSSGRSRWWKLRNLLAITQVAGCAMLLVCSGLFLRTLSSSGSADTGMRYRSILLAAFEPLIPTGGIDDTKYLDSVLRRVRDIPGVESAALSTTVPLSLATVSTSITAEGAADRTGIDGDIYDVSDRFFETVGIRFVTGEDFRQASGHEDAAILNQAAADRLFPDNRALGRLVQDNDHRTYRVVGIVATAKSRMMAEGPRPSLYRPIAGGAANALTGITVLARTRGNPAAYSRQLAAAVREVDAGLALFDVRTMEQHLNNALLLQRVGGFLFGLAGGIGIIIAGTGLYGLLSFLVALQTRELGIRMALGASRLQIVIGVMRRGLGLTAAGLAIGLSLASLVGKGIATLLFGVSPRDPITFAAVTLFLAAVALCACAVPASQAARIPPGIAIRSE